EPLGQDSHFARLRLHHPERFHDVQAFREENARYRPIRDVVLRLLHTRYLADSDRLALVDWLGARATALIDRLEGAGETGAEAAPRILICQRLDRHGTGRVLYRNTRAVISGFPERELHGYPLACPANYEDLEGRAALYPENGLQDE